MVEETVEAEEEEVEEKEEKEEEAREEEEARSLRIVLRHHAAPRQGPPIRPILTQGHDLALPAMPPARVGHRHPPLVNPPFSLNCPPRHGTKFSPQEANQRHPLQAECPTNNPSYRLPPLVLLIIIIDEVLPVQHTTQRVVQQGVYHLAYWLKPRLRLRKHYDSHLEDEAVPDLVPHPLPLPPPLHLLPHPVRRTRPAETAQVEVPHPLHEEPKRELLTYQRKRPRRPPQAVAGPRPHSPRPRRNRHRAPARI
uniref:Uncharacterized protein n=1 Tax=Cacopsylla melanoneura TaxID=428564 RepID=A0A8D8UR92_9HEMI